MNLHIQGIFYLNTYEILEVFVKPLLRSFMSSSTFVDYV